MALKLIECNKKQIPLNCVILQLWKYHANDVKQVHDQVAPQPVTIIFTLFSYVYGYPFISKLINHKLLHLLGNHVSAISGIIDHLFFFSWLNKLFMSLTLHDGSLDSLFKFLNIAYGLVWYDITQRSNSKFFQHLLVSRY